MKKAGRILPMNKPQKESQRLASWLADAVMTEMAKPEEEIDVEFVESCENLLNTIMGEKKLTDEEIEIRVNKIMEKRSKPRSVPIKRKTAFIAIIAAVVFLISGITVCATTLISQYILKTLDLGLNQSVSEGEISYTYGGMSVNYESIDAFLETEKLTICYPEYIPYNSKIIQVIRTDLDQTVFIFDDTRVSFTVCYDDSTDLSQEENSERINFHGNSFFIKKIDSIFTAYAQINNATYYLSCDKNEELINMIYGLNFERLK